MAADGTLLIILLHSVISKIFNSPLFYTSKGKQVVRQANIDKILN